VLGIEGAKLQNRRRRIAKAAVMLRMGRFNG
jgi:hypothetical protein